MRWKFPVTMMIYCDHCGKHFDIVIPGEGPRNYRCTACDQVHVFDLDDFVDKAIEQCRKMLPKTRGGGSRR